MAKPKSKDVIGWREWVQLPELSDAPIKAKIDTGARTSALHAFDLTVSTGQDGLDIATFEVHPAQRSRKLTKKVSLPVVSHREIRSSNGGKERRPVIRVTIELGGVAWPIDLTLTSRDEMGFRMLLGRAAIRRRFVVDPGRSFVLSAESARAQKKARNA